MGQNKPKKQIIHKWAYVFGHNSVTILANRPKSFKGTQEAITDQLLVRNHGSDTYFKILYFLWENWRGCFAGTKGCGASTPDLQFAPLDRPLSQNCIPENFRHEPPLKFY